MKLCKESRTFLISILLILSAVLFFNREEKACCLCNSFRYHAPCLIDLETGDLLELDLYLSHESEVAELADPQPEMGVLVFDKLGSVTVVKNTVSKTAEFSLLCSERTMNPALCRECRKQAGVFPMRYMLADLYAQDEKSLIPIQAGISTKLRCYTIHSSKGETGTRNISIQGVLP